MNGELAQVICLAAHGGTWLTGPAGAQPPDVESSSWTFRYVGRLGFSLELPTGSTEEFGSVADWLRALRERGVERLFLVTGSVGPVQVGGQPVAEHYLVAFAGAGSWSLLATGRSNEIGRATWEVEDLHAADQRIWDVRYHGAVLGEEVEPPRPSLAESELRLREALHAARDFAAANGFREWADVFEGALADAPAAPTDGGDEFDLLPVTASDAARSLAAMASRAWVFGGMGSWNDVGVSDPAARETYERVSEDLYQAVLQALVAATNADLTSG